MAQAYKVVIEHDSQEGYVATFPELVDCLTQAQSLNTLMERIRETLAHHPDVGGVVGAGRGSDRRVFEEPFLHAELLEVRGGEQHDVDQVLLAEDATAWTRLCGRVKADEQASERDERGWRAGQAA